MSNDARLATLLAEIRTTFDADFDPLDIDGQTLHLLTVRNMPQHLDSLLARKAIHNPLKDLPLIIIASGRKAPDDLIERCKTENIAILSVPETLYATCVKLAALGLAG